MSNNIVEKEIVYRLKQWLLGFSLVAVGVAVPIVLEAMRLFH